GSAGNTTPQSDRGRRASIQRSVRHQVRGALAARGARASRCDDELRRPARRAAAATRPGHLPRHWLCDLRRGNQSLGCFLWRRRLAELARIAYFRPDTLPPGFQAELMATRHYVPRRWPFAFTNGIQASWLEVDTDSGFVTLLKHWCVEDCGTVINPQLLDEQIRGGVVQGIGAALFEHCVYDERGQLLNGNMADYLVPMAGEM